MASSDEGSVSKTLHRMLKQGERGEVGRSAAFRTPRKDGTLVHIGLQETIQHEIIPRLVLSHRLPASADPASRTPDPAELQRSIVRTADAAEREDSRAVRAEADAALDGGLPLEQVYIQLLAGAARELGQRWDSDEIDFLRVSLAVGVLQALLRELAEDFQHLAAGHASERRILLIPTPGEQHGFGMAMVAEVFRFRGWHVETDPAVDLAGLEGFLRHGWYDVVGLSLGHQSRLPELSEAIRQIRRCSRNRRVGIMVGGSAFLEHPEWLSRVGADAFGQDAVHAVEQASGLVGMLAERRG